MTYSISFTVDFFYPRTLLAKWVVFMNYYLLMTPKISVHNSRKLLCSTINLVFYKLIHICTSYFILLEIFQITFFSVISFAQPFYKVKRAKAFGFHLSSVMNLGLKTHLPFSRWQSWQQCCLLFNWSMTWTNICQPLTKPENMFVWWGKVFTQDMLTLGKLLFRGKKGTNRKRQMFSSHTWPI